MLNKIYFINLDKEYIRRKKIEKYLNNLYIPYIRFPGINGYNINNNEIYHLYNNNIIKYNLQVEKKGRLGTYLSHYYLLKKIYINEDKNTINLILEDDAIIPINFISNFKIISKYFPKNFDIMFLGHLANIEGTPINKYILKASNISKPHTNNGLFAYLINRDSIPKIMKLLSPIKNNIYSVNNRVNVNHIDWELRKYYGTHINAYYTMNNLIYHNEKLKSNRKYIDRIS